MAQQRALQAVIDTNVLFEGLTTQGSAPGLIIDAWHSRLFIACISNALAYEYVDVLRRKLAPAHWRRLQPVLGMLLTQARFIPIYFFRGGPYRQIPVMTMSLTAL
jgi:predicted nucleic acid-binding protein